jgi:deoxyadenosine/deoxycytidine kinase
VDRPRLIVVEGPIGVGKSSLADRVADRLGARKLFEAVADNPFLADFYRDRRRYAFQAQLFFLLSRYRQQRELQQVDLFSQGVVSDYLFAKDRIFAYLNLDDNELALYERIHALLEVRVPKPDLVIYLQASTDVLLARLAERGLPYEKGISREYLEDVNQAYSHFFFHYKETPLLVVNTSEIDFVKRREDLDDLLRAIRQPVHGARYYVPHPV